VKFVPMLELLQDAAAGGYAVPSFCVWSAEVMDAVLGTAQDLRAPVILMNGPGEFGALDAAVMGDVARAVAWSYATPAALHLDHGNSIPLVRTCIDAGYTSVMLDYSTRPFEENASALREVVAMARPLGVTVEGEIGHVGRASTMAVEGEGDSQLTCPDEAAAFAEQTGVDALAVAIGNAHGRYARLPQFDFARLSAIRQATGIPLVLHGGSGTPDEDIRRAISLGMAKINVATEIVTAMSDALHAQGAVWLPYALAKAVEAAVPVIARWLELSGAAGKA
jgi:fructose-bisphosphate aldolase class II